MSADRICARISVVMPVYNGAATLDRAIQSLLRQTFHAWELLAVDDGSTDGSRERLQRWAQEDARIRCLQMPVNSGPAAARNTAIRQAAGDMIAYLDCDDEYYPDHLEQADRFGNRADVLVFSYDLVFDDAGPSEPVMTWNPADHRDRLFVENIMTPLGVAHRRDLGVTLGGFDESLRFEEDWDLWKRLARAGSAFAYIPFKSGLYHIRKNSLSRSQVESNPKLPT